VVFEKKYINWCSSAEWILEGWVPWDDAIVVSAGKLRKLWDSLSELRSSLWKTTGKDSSEAYTIACQNCTVYSVFLSGMTSHSKITQFNWECVWRLTEVILKTTSLDITKTEATCSLEAFMSLLQTARPHIANDRNFKF